MAGKRDSSDRPGAETPPLDKSDVYHKEAAIGTGVLNAEDSAFLANFSEERRRKVLRKVDVRCLGCLWPVRGKCTDASWSYSSVSFLCSSSYISSATWIRPTLVSADASASQVVEMLTTESFRQCRD